MSSCGILTVREFLNWRPHGDQKWEKTTGPIFSLQDRQVQKGSDIIAAGRQCHQTPLATEGDGETIHGVAKRRGSNHTRL